MPYQWEESIPLGPGPAVSPRRIASRSNGVRDRMKNGTQRVHTRFRTGTTRCAPRYPMANGIAMFRAQSEPSASPLPMPVAASTSLG